MLSSEYKFLTICLKTYILRTTCRLEQIAQKIGQNSLSFMRKNSAKVRKKNFAQKILPFRGNPRSNGPTYKSELEPYTFYPGNSLLGGGVGGVPKHGPL